MTYIPFPLVAMAAMAETAFVFYDSERQFYDGRLGAGWAPGRVNLIGEHTDYNDGYALPVPINRMVALGGHRRVDKQVRLWSMHFKEYARFALEGLQETFEQQKATLPAWACYSLAVVAELMSSGAVLSGFDAVVYGDVPIGAGMGSSAALEVATAYACALFANGSFRIESNETGEGGSGEALTFTPMQIAALCQRAEYRASGVRSGILDQAASCLAQHEQAMLLDCRTLEHSYLPFPTVVPCLVALIGLDSGVRRTLASSAYNERRQQCEEATALLRALIMQHEPSNTSAEHITALRDVTQEQFDRYKQYLPELLARRAGFVIAENARVLQVVQLLKEGRIADVGPILLQSHAGLRDDYEVSCMELDALVEIVQNLYVKGMYGGRMMGGGFGGCTINLVRPAIVTTLQSNLEKQYLLRTQKEAMMYVLEPTGVAGCAYFEPSKPVILTDYCPTR